MLTFDYRGFGQSEGEPARLQPSLQIEDITNALAFMRSSPIRRQRAHRPVGNFFWKDGVNPVEESKILFQKANEPKELFVIENATHYELYTGVYFEQAIAKQL